MIELYYLSLIVLLFTLVYASYLDLRDRRVAFKNWCPLLLVGTISLIYYIIDNYYYFDLMTVVIILTTVVIFWLCGYFKLYGGADAWCLIFITLFSLTLPFSSLLDNAYTGIGVSTYINSYIVYIITYPFHKYMFDRKEGVPYIIFITFGFIIAILVGDIYNYIVGVIL